jgi:hypothetical protein
MSLSLGIYDVFSYAVPGSLYLFLGTFIADRLHWISAGRLEHGPTVLVVGGIVVASYLLGFFTYPLAAVIDRLLPYRRGSAAARAEFLRNVPAASGRPYAQADLRLLLAAAEMQASDVSQEVIRMRAIGIMTRNCAIPLTLASVTALAGTAAGAGVLPSVVAALLCAAAAAAALWQARRFRHWANLKVLEICYWIPEIDRLVQGPLPAEEPRSVRRPRSRSGSAAPAARSVPPRR